MPPPERSEGYPQHISEGLKALSEGLKPLVLGYHGGMTTSEKRENVTLTDVFMPEDLCARCAEEDPVADIFLVAVPSPSSTFKQTKLFFCSEKCRGMFARGWKAARELDGVL